MSFSAADEAGSIAELSLAVTAFADARDWRQFHDPKNLAMALASEVGELTALLRWVRNDESDASVAGGPLRDRLEAEIGDVGICLLLLCARARIDLGAAVSLKLEANAAKYPVGTSRGRADPPDVGRGVLPQSAAD